MKYSDLPSLSIRKIILLISLAISNIAFANETEIKPFIKGSFNQIQKEHINQAYIITFWSESCAFCMKELSLFGKLLKSYPNISIVSVTTDPFLKKETVEQILTSKNLPNVQKWVFADHYVERVYFDIDKSWRGELPLTYFFDKNNKMIKHLGVIKEQALTEWLVTQSPTS